MRSLGALAFRFVAERWARLAMTGAAVALGVAIFTGALLTRASIRSAFDDIGRGTGDVVATSTTGDDEVAAITPGTVERLRSLPDVEAVWPRLATGTSVLSDLGTTAWGANRPAPVGLVGMDAHDPLLARLDMTSGRRGLGDGGVLLSAPLARQLRAGVGATVRLATAAGYRPAAVTGVFEPDAVLPGGSDPRLMAVVRLSGASAFRSTEAVTSVDIDLREGVEAKTWIAHHRAAVGTTMDLLTGAHRLGSVRPFFVGLSNVLTMVGGAVMLAGAALANLAMTTHVVERTRLFGLLHALGARRRQVRRLVLTEALALGAVASGVGAVVGIGVGTLLIWSGGAQFQRFGITLRVDPILLVLPIVAGTVITVIAGLSCARRAARLEPTAALQHVAEPPASTRRRAVVTGGLFILGLGLLLGNSRLALPLITTALLQGLPVYGGRLAGFIGRATRRLDRRVGPLAVRRVARNGARSVAFLAVAVVILLVVGTITDSIEGSVRDELRADLGTTDLSLDAPAGLPPSVIAQVRSRPEVLAVQATGNVETRVDLGRGETMHVTVRAVADAATGLAGFRWVAGRPAEALARLDRGGAVLVATSLADDAHLDVGDTIGVRTTSGVRPFAVAGVVRAVNTPPLVVAGLNDAIRWLGLPAPTGLKVDLRDDRADSFLAFVRQEVAPQVAVRVTRPSELFADVHRQVAGTSNLFLVVGLLLAVVAVLGLANTAIVAVLQEQHEIGVLRALGGRVRDIRRMLLVEGATLAGVALAVGLPVGLVFAVRATQTQNPFTGDVGSFAFPWGSLPLILGVLVAAAVVPALWASRHARRLDVDTILRFE
jgi:putative ABC transport system permease protein